MKNFLQNQLSSFSKILITILLVLFWNLFLFLKHGPVSFSIKILSFLIFILLIFWNKEKIVKQSKIVIGTSLFLVISSFIQLTKDSGLSLFLSEIFSYFALSILIYCLASEIEFIRSLMEMVMIPVKIGLSYLKSFFEKLKLVVSQQNYSQVKINSNGKFGLLKSIIFGTLISLPVASILILLLSKADPIFDHFVKSILSVEFLKELPQRIIFSVVLFLILLPLINLRIKKEFYSPLRFLKSFNLTKEFSVVMVVIGVILGLFLVIQWPYVFANVAYETQLSQFGVATYSEYVKKGFGELLVISFLIYGLTWIGLIFARNSSKETGKWFRLIQIAVIFELLVFIFSIFRRVWLYQNYHGLTLARIYGVLFLVWLIGVIITLGLRHFWSKRWVITETIFSGFIVFFVGFINFEKMIVNNPPTVNNRIDYVYLSRLSTDGYDGWQKAYNNAEKILNNPEILYKNELNQDERREIAYAGSSLFYLTKNYHAFMKEYGDEQEWKEYYKMLLEFQKKQYEELSRLKEEKLEFDESRQKVKDNIIKISEILIKIDKNDFDIENSPYLYINCNSCDFPFYSDVVHVDQLSFYNFDLYNLNPLYYRNYRKYSKSKFEKFLIWNWSKTQAFSKMKQDMDINKLNKMQENYFKLSLKISKQNEKDFERDISTDGAFLKSSSNYYRY